MEIVKKLEAARKIWGDSSLWEKLRKNISAPEEEKKGLFCLVRANPGGILERFSFFVV